MDLGTKILSCPVSVYENTFFDQGPLAAFEAMLEGFNQLGRAQEEGFLIYTADLSSCQIKQSVQDLLSTLTPHLEKIRVTALRKDWLFQEDRVILILNGLCWALMMERGEFLSKTQNREAYLRAVCEEMGAGRDLESIFEPADLRQQADSLISVVLKVIDYLRPGIDGMKIKFQNRLLSLRENPDQLVYYSEVIREIEDLERTQNKIVSCLAKLPETIGIFLTGSSARDFTRDKFSDLDIVCVCSEIPDDFSRDRILHKLDVKSSFRFGSFEHIGMPDADVHLVFVKKERQEKVLEDFRSKGEESPIMDFRDEEKIREFACCVYCLASNKILWDPNGILQSFKNQTHNFPPLYKQQICAKWTPVWMRYKKEFHYAQQQGDRLSALTALHYCIQASLRILLANYEIYCNPIEPKWISVELNNLLNNKTQRLQQSILDQVPLDVTETFLERFKKAEYLWKISTKRW